MTATGEAESVLHLTDIVEPDILASTQVKIKIKAAGINPIDTKVRQKGVFFPQPLPAILGCDGAGEIVGIGSDVNDYQVGDAVWFCHGGLGQEQGNYAEYTVIESRYLALKPNHCSFNEAAALPLVLITAWGALFDRGHLQQGESVLIHAGAGGVGHIAIQLAKLKGATVFTTVSSQEKAAFVRALGADHVIIYSEQNFVDEINRITDGNGVDLVIDTVGAEVFKASISITAFFGRLITLLDPGEVSFAEARLKNLLIGFELMLTPQLKGLETAKAKQVNILKACQQWIEQGDIKVYISDILPLEQVVLAHQKIEQGHVQGKIVLQIAH